MKIRNLIFIPLILIIGCAEHISERSGPSIEVVPIEYQLAVKIEKNKKEQAWQYLDKYVSENWGVFANQHLSLSWNTKEGKKLVHKYADYLRSRGVESKNITLYQDSELNTAFDFNFSATVHKVVTPLCEYVTIGNYGEVDNGCFSDGMRWKSITHPERMFDNSNY